MNAAARLLNQGALSRGWIISVLISRVQVSVCLFVVAIIMTALSMVYATNNVRGLTMNLQQTLSDRNHLDLQWHQLLLEHGTLSTQGRIQAVAEQKYQMIIPDNKSVVMISE